VPLLVPLAGDTVSQPLSLVAPQVQPDPAVTVIVPVPPAAATDAVAGDSAYVHGAACVTVIVCPPIVTVPVRALVVVFAATV
jgi:hypothetical protein